MNGIRAEVQENAPSGPPGSIWDRLRENIARLAEVGRRDGDPAARAERLAARAQMLRGRIAAPEAEAPLVFLAFTKGRVRYGVLLDEVLEVGQLEHFSVGPCTPLFIAGVIHWRGAIVALLDLGRLFNVPETGLADSHFFLIVEAAGRRLALAAREIEDIARVPRAQLGPYPGRSPPVRPEWVLGVHDDNRVLLCLEQLFQDERMTGWRTS
jgi:purine-binding chemotaxis protein CheW